MDNRPIIKTLEGVYAVAWIFGTIAGAFDNGRRFMYRKYDILDKVLEGEEEKKPKRHIGFTAQF